MVNRANGHNVTAKRLEHVRSHPQVTMLITSYIPGNRGAERLFMKFGFRPHPGPNTTGEIELTYDL